MLVRYVGGLEWAAPASGEFAPVQTGGTLDVPEDLAARLVSQGDWETVDETAKPKKKAADPVAPQVGD